MYTFRRILIVLIAAISLTACGGQQKADEVKITMTDFGIKSSMTDFKVGVPYHFVVTNEGKINHEMMIMPPLMADQMGMAIDMAEMDKMALAMIEGDELTPGTTKSFDYTFTEPAGSLEFACHTPGHYEAGMKLPITVK